MLLTHDHQNSSTMIEPLRGYSVNCFRAGRVLAFFSCAFMRTGVCFLVTSVRSYCSRPLDQAVECGADDDSTPSGAARDCVSVFPMFLVALVGHTLARPTRWSTWSFFHVTSTQFSAYIYLVLCSALCSWLCQSAPREFLFLCCCKLLLFAIAFFSISNT